MQVKDVLEKKGRGVVTISQDRSVQDAVGLLMDQKLGSLIAVDEAGHIAGIITERDVLRECARDANGLRKRKVSEAMTRPVILGKPEDGIKSVQRLMTERRIRHLPIVTERGELAGMISIGDVLKGLLEASESENYELRDFLIEKNVVA